jgi:hypothetical protein
LLKPTGAHPVPPLSRPAFAVPQNRASHPAPLPVARHPRATVPSAKHQRRLLGGYLPVVGAALLLGFSPLAYVIARDCGSSPHEPLVIPSASDSARLIPSVATRTQSGIPTSNPSLAPAPPNGVPSPNVFPVTSATTFRAASPSPTFSASHARDLPPNPYISEPPPNPYDPHL